MVKAIIKYGHWEDEKGFRYFPNFARTTTYPNGQIQVLVLESMWGTTTFIRYNEVGTPISGDMELKFKLLVA